MRTVIEDFAHVATIAVLFAVRREGKAFSKSQTDTLVELSRRALDRYDHNWVAKRTYDIRAGTKGNVRPPGPEEDTT